MKFSVLFPFLALLISPLLPGCARIPGQELRSEPVIGAPTFYFCPGITKSPIHIAIKPREKLSGKIKALLLPIDIRQEIEYRTHLGQELGREFMSALQEENTFDTIYYQPTQLHDLDLLLSQAAKAGANLLVMPTSNYLFYGGSQGLFSLDLHLKIYSTATRQLIWSSEQSAELRRPFYQDYILFKTSPRMPSSPAKQTINALAHDLAIALKTWLYTAVPAKKTGQTTDSLPWTITGGSGNISS